MSADLKTELLIVVHLLIAFALGAFIGIEREKHHSPAGIRTYAAVCMGAALFTFIGIHSNDTAAASRIVANIVTGIGFLGAGIIYKNNSNGFTHGLTTASTIWAAAAVGVAVAYSMFLIATAATLTIYFLLALPHFIWYQRFKQKWKKEKNQIENDEE